MSIFKKIYDFLAKHLTSKDAMQQAITTAKSVLGLIGPLATSIVAFTAGAEGATEAATVVTEIQADLGTVLGLLNSYDVGHPSTVTQSITATLNSVTGSLNGFLTAGHIKNPDLQSKIGLIVSTISAEVKEAVSALPS